MIGGWGTSAAHAGAYVEQEQRWPNGIVYYEFADRLPQDIKDATTRAIDLANYYSDITGVTIAPASGFQPRVRIYDTTGPSHVSQTGYFPRPGIGISRASMWINTSTPHWQVVLHQFGHIMGLSDEHRRCDRDDWVDAPDLGETEKECHLLTAERYNTMSIMHYSERELADVGASLRTGTAPPKSQHPGFVDSDLRTLATMYRSDGEFSLVSVMHGKCIDLVPSMPSEASVARMQSCDPHDKGQRWSYSAASGELEANGMCLEGTFSRNQSGIVATTCSGSTSQQWDVGQYGDLVLRHVLDERRAPLCATIADSSRLDGAELTLEGCHRGDNQQWRRSPDGSGSVSANTVSLISDLAPANLEYPRLSKCMDAYWIDIVYLVDCDANNGFQRFTRTVAAELRHGSLCVDGGEGQVSSALVQRACTGAANQRWELTSTGALRGVNGLCVEVKNGSVEHGAASQLLLASCVENKLAQQWSTRWPR